MEGSFASVEAIAGSRRFERPALQVNSASVWCKAAKSCMYQQYKLNRQEDQVPCVEALSTSGRRTGYSTDVILHPMKSEVYWTCGQYPTVSPLS